MRRVVRTPAKVNLSLLVGPVAEDGYHPLSTVFVPVQLYDHLEFDLSAAPPAAVHEDAGHPPGERGLEVVCPGIEQESNLVTRAVRAVESLTGWVVSGTIRVSKGIPVGAGLGGGSSDAAAALRVAAELVEVRGGPRLDAAPFLHAARALGADVPFFLAPGPALAAGVGDVLEPLALPCLHLVLLLPERPLATAEVYRTFDRVSPGERPEEFERRRRTNETVWRGLVRQGDGERRGDAVHAAAVAALLENDLERAAFRLVPHLAGLKDLLLEAGALGALMSGSGPTVFGVFGSAEEAASSAHGLARAGRRAVAVATRE